MPAVPSKLYRQTKHAKPRFQLYLYGFNVNNGCWLNGKWITVDKDEWDCRKDKHDAMYAHVRQAITQQHYRNPGVAPEQMTPAQKQAWEFFSGEMIMSCVYPNGTIGMVSVDMAGQDMSPESQAGLRKSGHKILRWVGSGDKAVDQTEGLTIPDDLICQEIGNTENPVDPWQHIIAQNSQQEDDMFNAMLGSLSGAAIPAILDGMGLGGISVGLSDFSVGMAFHMLVKQEETLVSWEWHAQRGQVDKYRTHEQEVARYVDMRSKLMGRCGNADVFKAHYEQHRAEHNQCARNNLGDSGVLFSFVLPEFHEDGSHEPWGPRDVPWGQTETVVAV